MLISLLGTLNVKFADIEGRDQTIKVQLPDYVLANFIAEENKPRVALINGPMSLIDESNNLKSVIIIHGLVKKSSLFSTTYEPNLTGEKLIEGKIYRRKESKKQIKLPIEELT